MSTSRRGHVAARRPVQRLIVALLTALLLLTGCGGDPEPVPAEVAALLDVPGTSVAVLGESATEVIPRVELAEAVERARALGEELRVVVAGDGHELVDAKVVADNYGGTVLSFEAGGGRDRSDFTVASADLDIEQINRATGAAAVESDMGASALAFVGLLEEEGPEAKSTSVLQTALWIGLALAAVFVLWQLWRFLQARKQAERRRRMFTGRRDILADWANRLEAEADQVTNGIAALDGPARRTLDETRSQLASAAEGIERATALGDLDAHEIRIARAAMKLRVLRQKVSS